MNVENDEKLTLIKLLYKKMPFLWHFFVLYLTCYDKRGCAIIDFDLLFVNIQVDMGNNQILIREANRVKYLRQFGIILAVTCAGEIMKYFIPLPIPGSIYGLILMFLLLLLKVIKVEHVKETGEFLIEIMPLMFIPAGVGLITSWGQLQSFLVPLLVITVVSTFVVMIVTGKVTDFLISRMGKGEKK